MSEIIIPKPNGRQALFLKDRHKYVGFGGARGGGKSWAVRAKAALLAARYPGIKIMIIRRTYPELRSNHILPLKELLGDAAKFNQQNKEFQFKNGSMILLRAAQNEADMDKYQGTEVDVLFIDEATQFTEEQFDRIKACVRGVNDFPKRIYATCNPGGVGHTWVKRLFVDRAYKPSENAEEYVFYRSLVTDNKALMDKDPEYIKQLEALPPKLRKAWLEGDWDIFEGQFFEEFQAVPTQYDIDQTGLTKEELIRQRRYTHVIDDFPIPNGWTIYRSFDFGYAKPFSCDWWAIDYDGRAYLFRQLYGWNGLPNEGCKWDPDLIFDRIHRIETEDRNIRGRMVTGIADPSIFDVSRGDSIADFADRHFVHFLPGDNKRLPGWMQCHYRFKFDKNGFPMVYFFRSCENAIRTIPLLQYDEIDPEDLNTTQEDHFADSFRYFCMSRPITPQHEEITADRLGDDPLDLRRN